MTRILILDIETAPNLAYVWGFFKEHIAPKQVLEDCSILSWSAKWLGDKDIMYADTQQSSELDILTDLCYFLDKADIVIGHNLKRFDMPKIRGRCLVNGISLPSPYKEIDTYTTARRAFGFDRNTLAEIARMLGVEAKGDHKKFPGFELWSECLKGNNAAWKDMKKYNKQDVLVTEQVYLKIRPYITNHPAVTVHGEIEDICCPKCGADEGFQERRGYAYTNVGKYQRYKCNHCGGWHRGRKTILPTTSSKHLTVSI